MQNELIAVKKAHNKPTLTFFNDFPAKNITTTLIKDGITEEILSE